ncbi:hypothetical protein C0389_05055 [bacterium]|nr:hypothetical protein [bacterium]
MEEKQALDELRFIKKVIEDSQKIIADNGMGYIVWGIIIVVGMLGGYLKFKLRLDFDYIWAWVILISLGWIFSYFMYKKPKNKVRVETFAGKIMGMLWFSIGMGMTIAGFVGYFSHAIRGEYISAIMAIFLGSAYYLTSVLNNQKWFKIIGVLWWIGGVVIFYVGGLSSLLIMAFLITVGQIIPGIILYRKHKKQCCEDE